MIGSTIVMPAFEPFEVLGFVRGAEHVRVGRVGLFGAHAVLEPGAPHVLRHLGAAAQFVDELLVEPRLVDPQARVGQQAIAVEPLDVVPFERAAVAPDVDVVFLHRHDEHRAGHGAADGRRVEVGARRPWRCGTRRLERGQALGDELLRGSRSDARAPRRTAARGGGFRRSPARRAGRGSRCMRRESRLVAHPVQRGARVEPAGKRDADLLAGWKLLENGCHIC